MPRKGYKQTKEHKQKTSIYLKPFKKGQRHTEESRKKMSGENNHFWKGGVTPLNKKIRESLEYKLWRKSVYEKDNYVCIWCGDKRGGNLQADHIKPFADYPELRFAIDNGRTLCKECHMKTDTWGKRRSL